MTSQPGNAASDTATGHSDLDQRALAYHRWPRPGKLETKPIKPLGNQHDLALAYSPGVAAACREIVREPLTAADYTARGNLVAVITNGSAVLGLGAIGGLAAKPVMEGKAVLFKQFADIDVFDLELDADDPAQMIDTIARLEPTFGGINLEDIKAPECFIVERGLRERMNIPVFHDDQHGTAIVVCAAILNGLQVTGKALEDVRLVTAGAGAAALACLELLVALGLARERVIVTDIDGVVHAGREAAMDPWKARFAADTPLRSLAEALDGADIFLGLSAGGVLRPEWLARMARQPLVLALANPEPEIMPDAARAARPDAIIATGRSDFSNQVNNVLCFPFLFRGALDCGATEINEAMKLAAVHAIAELARAEPSDIVRSAYGGEQLRFGPDYLIPRPFDPRLMETVAPAVARAAMESGVAHRPITDLAAYRESLHNRVYRTGMTMKPVFDQAREQSRRVAFAEGEEERVLEAAQQAHDQGIARPLLIGRRDVITARLAALGLGLRIDIDADVLDPAENPAYPAHAGDFFQRVQRRGYSPQEAAELVRHDSTVLAALLTAAGECDAMICGTVGRYQRHLAHVAEIVGTAPGVTRLSSMNALVLHSGVLFIADTYVQEDPDAEALAEITLECARQIRRFGLPPKVALLSHSNFGSHDNASARKMRDTRAILHRCAPDLEVEGEMHANLALLEGLREARFPASRLSGRANLLVMPNQDAANIAYNLLKVLGGGVSIGPILLGAARPAHIVTPSVTVRGLLNMTALAAAQAGEWRKTRELDEYQVATIAQSGT